MEGPSLYLAHQQLRAFKGQPILSVEGNTKIDKRRLKGVKVLDIFSWGKHLVFQFDRFAIRFHFLLFGTFEARVKQTWVTGDYRRARVPRLRLIFQNGEINTYHCSIQFLESAHAKHLYDFSLDIMSPKWDAGAAVRRTRAHPNEAIADLLLDQTVFAGVGNMIKNEILSILRIHPKQEIGGLSQQKCVALVEEARAFSRQFYRWRKKFVLRAHLKVHRKGVCPYCKGQLLREQTGKRKRWSYWCPVCQKLRK